MINIVNIGEIVGAILIICQAIKMAGVASRFIPLLSILIGLGGALLFGGVDWANTLVGIVLGLGTTLLFREVKAAVM